MDPASVSIVVPALNEENAIGPLVKDLKERFAEAQVIVVDDGSTDETAQRAAAQGAQVISHDHSRGYGAALMTGTDAATREYVLFCDGDGQHSVNDVGRLMEECDSYDMVVGRRDQDSHQEWIRRPGKWVLQRFANYLAGQDIPDLNSGLRVFKRETLKKYLHLMPTGFSFSSTSTVAMLKSRRRCKYVPITVRKRIGKSSVRQWRHGPQTLMLILRLAVLFEPLKVFLTVSAGLFVLTLISLAVDILYNPEVISDSTVILSVGTLITFMFGLVCDQVSAMRREKHE